MGVLSDTSRFLELSLLLAFGYVAYGYYAGHDVDVLAIALFLAGCLAIVLVAYRFADDFSRESE